MLSDGWLNVFAPGAVITSFLTVLLLPVLLSSITLGVMYGVTSTPSKKQYTLVLGFILYTSNAMFLDLIHGTAVCDNTVSPRDFLSILGTILVLIPCLD